MTKQKYYVVWNGRKRGIFNTWNECSAQVNGFTGARYKSFESLAAAESALRGEYQQVEGKPASLGKWKTAEIQPQLPSICVDAACAGVPGPVEWRGVKTETGEELFRSGPYLDGTNNIGEFLAIVDGLAWLGQKNLSLPVYSDSANAILWFHAKKCRTKMELTAKNAILFKKIAAAEEFLRTSRFTGVLKWETEIWGENPADFGRK